MTLNNIFEQTYLKFKEKEELSVDKILSESNSQKIKNRKKNLFQKMMSIRAHYSINFNDKKYEKKINLKELLEKINNNNDKIIIINNIFINNIKKVKEIISKYNNKINYNIDYYNESFNPNSECFSSFILDLIEDDQSFSKNIILNQDNINCLINRINLISNEKTDYDHNYIMILVYFSILDENVNKILRNQIDHQNLIKIIKKHETYLSYIYLFYIYGFIYHLTNQEIEQYEGILDTIIEALINNNNCKNDELLWEIYNLLTYFSRIKKFIGKFYDNFIYIFFKKEFYEKDTITIEKLKIINNLFLNMNNNEIYIFLQKDNGTILNLTLFCLKLLSDNNHIKKVKNDIIKLKMIIEIIIFLLIITHYKDLTLLLLENKKFLFLIIKILKNFNYDFMLENNNNVLLNEIITNLFAITNNIILNEHDEFISKFLNNKIYLSINNIIEFYSKSPFLLNKSTFQILINIIKNLFDYEKKIYSNSISIKKDLEINNFYNLIYNIISSYNKDSDIYIICKNFLDTN